MIPKIIIEGVFKLVIKQFKLDKLEKVYEYVFGENELDNKCDNLDKRLKKVEAVVDGGVISNCICKCSKEDKKKWYDK
jgi:hypothetical protein|tara:strand:+ start:79 stop:312 length:234 start_codon:yes stop_codon:yes gene_type:complete